jgi:hypothetical protein
MSLIRPRSLHRCKGTALIEFVMTIPLLALVVVATFFLGWAVVNRHAVAQASRYSSWHAVRGGSSTADLDENFYANRTQTTSVGRDGGQIENLEAYVDRVGSYDANAGVVAEACILGDSRRWPRGRAAEVVTDFDSSVAAWERWADGSIRARHSRDGVEWRNRQIDPNQALADHFLTGLDDALSNVPPDGQGLANIMRSLYMSRW